MRICSINWTAVWSLTLWLTCAQLYATGFGPTQRFVNQFLEFNLPMSFSCQFQQTAWTCEENSGGPQKRAVFVIAGKLTNSLENLPGFKKYLFQKRQFISPTTRRAVYSQPRYVRETVLNGHDWVDSLHYNSEIEGYFTRYLATVRDGVTVLVTYSVRKEDFQAMDKLLNHVAESLTVLSQKAVAAAQGGAPAAVVPAADIATTDNPLPPSLVAPAPEFLLNPIEPAETAKKAKRKPASSSDDTTFYLLLLGLGGLVGYVTLKRLGVIRK